MEPDDLGRLVREFGILALAHDLGQTGSELRDG
jgi:hypothetical protein